MQQNRVDAGNLKRVARSTNRGSPNHEMRRNGDLLVLLLHNTLLPSSKLNPYDTKVGPAKIQCIKQPMLIPAG